MLDELFIRGGPVLYVLFFITLLIFYILIDKYNFLVFQSNEWRNNKLLEFKKEFPPETTDYKVVDRILLSSISRESKSNIKILQGLISMCPMIGLLGTVYGMIEVFEVFVKETGVDINRPNAETAERDEKGNILVALTENNEIWIDKRRVDLKAVRANIERLKIEYPGGSVIIQADKLSKSGLLVETMDQIRLAGIQNISIAAKNDN